MSGAVLAGVRHSEAGAGGSGAHLVKLAVLGDPLRHTRSPDLHRAGCAALGFECESVALRTSVVELPSTLARLAAEGFVGCNLTMPLKEPALSLVGRPSAAARRARSVNTIRFAPSASESTGDTTDGIGFVDLLRSHTRDVSQETVTLLGAGGSARSLALALADAGGRPVRVVSRRDPGPGEAWGGALGERWSEWGSAAADGAVAASTVLVNCTPLGGGEFPLAIRCMPRGALVVDLTYGEALSPWIAAAAAAGFDAVDGLALLVHQARHSFRCWFDRDVLLAPLQAAVRRGS